MVNNPKLSDLGPRQVIGLECRCGRREHIPPYELIGFKRISNATPLWQLRDRFRCIRCGGRIKRMWVEGQGNDDDQRGQSALRPDD